jgi:RNA-directed DNA polymerase
MLMALERGVKGNQWFSLIDKVFRDRTLELAWAKVHANAGACGVDGITVERFRKDPESFRGSPSKSTSSEAPTNPSR